MWCAICPLDSDDIKWQHMKLILYNSVWRPKSVLSEKWPSVTSFTVQGSYNNWKDPLKMTHHVLEMWNRAQQRSNQAYSFYYFLSILRYLRGSLSRCTTSHVIVIVLTFCDVRPLKPLFWLCALLCRDVEGDDP